MFLVNEIGEIIFEHGENFKESCVAKTKILKKFVLEKLATMVDDSKKEEIVEYTSEKYLKQIEKNLSLIFEDIDKSEKEFYANYMKTIDLIFKAESKNRMKVIYLENIIKKIENKELNSDSIISMKKSSENSDSDNSIPDKSVNEIFNEMIQDITKKYSLTPEQVADFKTKVIHYKDIYEQHLEEDLDKYFKHNKKCVITGIITEMDSQKLREGKTREQFLEEKKLADTAKNKSKELLDKIVSKNQNIALNRLEICSANMINLIFKLLPDEYKNQRQLLEIIIDTAINERVGNIIKEECKTLTRVLDGENKEIIQDEIYDEKRHNESEDYGFSEEIIDDVYKGIIQEIRIAYDIDKDSIESKKLDFSVSIEANSTKKVFTALVNDIIGENKVNITNIKNELGKLESDKISIENNNKGNGKM